MVEFSIVESEFFIESAYAGTAATIVTAVEIAKNVRKFMSASFRWAPGANHQSKTAVPDETSTMVVVPMANEAMVTRESVISTESRRWRTDRSLFKSVACSKSS